METADFVVIGLGVMGAAALAELSRHGKVIGLEAATPGHKGGSSHGDSRIFRLSNFESPGYTAFAAESLETWRAIERQAGDIYIRTGILEAGSPASQVIAGRLGDTTLERLTCDDVRQRFPIFDLPEGWSATFHPEAGILRADAAVLRFLEIACERQPGAVRAMGAESVTQSSNGVEVATSTGDRISAGAAVVTTGPWITQLIPELVGRVSVSLQTVGWFDSAGASAGPDRMPIFAIDTGGEVDLLYGFPDFAGLGIKAASHLPGLGWNPADPRPDDSAQRATLAAVSAEVARLMPRTGPLRTTTTCLYTNTADEEFIVDRRPEAPNVVFASACSGHGFKFAPAIAAMLSDLARNPKATTRFALS